jgi:hypothetical protein
MPLCTALDVDQRFGETRRIAVECRRVGIEERWRI